MRLRWIELPSKHGGKRHEGAGQMDKYLHSRVAAGDGRRERGRAGGCSLQHPCSWPAQCMHDEDATRKMHGGISGSKSSGIVIWRVSCMRVVRNITISAFGN